MKHVVITGANRGIGLELTRLYAREHKVYALCRKASVELEKMDQVRIIEDVELTDLSSIRHALVQCSDHIDILINNAGILQRVGLSQIDDDEILSIKDQFCVNALAPLLMVQSAKRQLHPGSKVVLITSRMGSISDNTSGGHYGYRMSKSALNAAGKSLAVDLQPEGVAVGILHPGWVQTQMTGHTGNYTVDQAASQLIERIDDLSLSNSGTFWHSNGERLGW